MAWRTTSCPRSTAEAGRAAGAVGLTGAGSRLAGGATLPALQAVDGGGQGADAFGAEARLLGEDVAPLQQLHLPLRGEQFVDLIPERFRKQIANTRITRLAFRNRFTMPEKAALELGSTDNPASAMPQRMQSATLRAYLADVSAATFIDLQHPDTRAGVQALESMGLLAAGRALEILDAPVAASERPLV